MWEYNRHVRRILETIEECEEENIRQAVDALIEANLSKNAIYVFGASHAGIIAEETYYRAGGLMTMNALFARELMLDTQPITATTAMEQLEGYGTEFAKRTQWQPGDVLIVHSVSGRNPVGIELAMYAKNAGATVIALTNVSYSASVTSRHSSGQRLFEVADIVIDNHGDVGDATCSIEGVEQKVGPTSTVVGASIMNTIVVETARGLVERGVEKPPIFYSANLDGGSALNEKLFAEYASAIKYRY